MDVIFPKNNEKEFSDIASKLGNGDLVSVYSLNDFKKSESSGILLTEKEIGKRKNADLVFVKAPSREALRKGVDVIYGLEEEKRKDFLHHRNSGINHIMANLCAEKGIIIAFSFNSVLKGNPSTILGRMKQNVKLCRKYKVKMCFASFATLPNEMRSLRDLESFGKAIGMNPSEVKKSFTVFSERIIYNRKKAAGKIPAEGVEILD